MLDVKPFLEGMPLYRQVQAGIEDMIRANPRAKEIPLSDVRLAERFGVSRITCAGPWMSSSMPAFSIVYRDSAPSSVRAS